MYEFKVCDFTIEQDGVTQTFSLEDYDYERELFETDFIEYMTLKKVTSYVSMLVINNTTQYIETEITSYNDTREI